MEGENPFKKVGEKIAAMKVDLPIIIANQAKRFFLNSFKDEGFTDISFVKWNEVQRRIPGTNAYKYPLTRDQGRHSRPILKGKGTGHLIQAVNSSLREVSWEKIRFNVALNYGAYHNEGAEHLAKRKFIGESKTLNDALKKKISTAFKSCFK